MLKATLDVKRRFVVEGEIPHGLEPGDLTTVTVEIRCLPDGTTTVQPPMVETRPCPCTQRDLLSVEHEANSLDWERPGAAQGYRVYQCLRCGAYWGCRHQYDAGTGHDDRWHKFDSPESVKRHY